MPRDHSAWAYSCDWTQPSRRTTSVAVDRALPVSRWVVRRRRSTSDRMLDEPIDAGASAPISLRRCDQLQIPTPGASLPFRARVNFFSPRLPRAGSTQTRGCPLYASNPDPVHIRTRLPLRTPIRRTGRISSATTPATWSSARLSIGCCQQPAPIWRRQGWRGVTRGLSTRASTMS